MENYIMGNFRQVIFESDKGYIIGLFKVKKTDIESMKDYVNKTITFTGYFHELTINENYYFKGEESFHQKYGFQFNVKEYERVKPDDKDGIVEFLSSDLFKGVGEKLAIKIVETLGEQALELILEDKSNLLLVPKMTQKKADSIFDTLSKYEESHKTIVYLTDLGFVMRDALLIFNKYKNNTLSVIEHNIYTIIDDIEEINFKKLDSIAIKMDNTYDSIERIKACTYYIMGDLTFKTGDTYLYREDIYDALIKYLRFEIDYDYFNEILEELAAENKINISDDKYYLSDIYEGTDNIINKINYLNNKSHKKYTNINSYIAELEEYNGIKYNDKQIMAIKKALENNILIITGGPGTGKTMIIKAIVEIYRKLNKFNEKELISTVALLAPTGRASKRLSESTNLPASTIHRFLKWNRESNTFNVNEYNPDFSNLIIVDEVSMIDIELMNNLLKGLTNNIKLILVGDYNQLPSVGPGMLLKDLIDSEVVDTVKLDVLYRQKENSYIPILADEIRSDNLGDFLSTKDDYTFLTCNSASIISNLKKICKQTIDKGYDYKREQIMAPMYAGINGIDNLNKELQSIFNPASKDKKEVKYGDVIYREGDKVLQLVNDPDNNVFNGDIGIIYSIKSNNQSKSGKIEVYIDFDGNMVIYQVKDLVNIKHGFIISIHKAQGSEFDLVIIPICRSYYRMLYKKLIYTGITRAKNKLIIIGEPDAFVQSVNSNNEQIRKSDMVEKLRKVCIESNNM